jgi:hypothetical protein
MDDVQQTVGSLRETTEEARQMLSELKAGGVVDDLEGTVANVQELTEQANDVLADLKPKADESGEGLVADLRESVSNAREATSDLAENAEAIKRNRFIRGFFKRRGFYDMDEISVDEYRRGSFAPKRDRRRTWIHHSELFAAGPDGEQTLSEQGKEELDAVIARYLVHAPNTPLIVEGYSAAGAESTQFLRSRVRASTARHYLIEKYDLKADYVGVMPMGAVESGAPGGGYWEGVAIVFFPKKR